MAKKQKTTDAVAILRDRFVSGVPGAEAELEEARDQILLSVKLGEMRRALGLTQQEVADRVGTSRTVIARLEQPGYNRHTLSTLRRVAAVLGHSVSVKFVPVEQGKVRSRRPTKAASASSAKRPAMTK